MSKIMNDVLDKVDWWISSKTPLELGYLVIEVLVTLAFFLGIVCGWCLNDLMSG